MYTNAQTYINDNTHIKMQPVREQTLLTFNTHIDVVTVLLSNTFRLKKIKINIKLVFVVMLHLYPVISSKTDDI